MLIINRQAQFRHFVLRYRVTEFVSLEKTYLLLSTGVSISRNKKTLRGIYGVVHRGLIYIYVDSYYKAFWLVTALSAVLLRN